MVLAGPSMWPGRQGWLPTSERTPSYHSLELQGSTLRAAHHETEESVTAATSHDKHFVIKCSLIHVNLQHNSVSYRCGHSLTS